MTEKQIRLSVGEVLKLGIQMEEEAANLYATLARRFAHVENIPLFWHGLSLDELGHAGILLSIFKSLTEDQLNESAQAKICESMNANLALLKEVQLDRIYTLDDAYELAYSLEFSEINSVFKFLSNKYISENFRAQLIASQIDDHQNKFKEFDKKYGNKAWRRQLETLPE
jgi:rubrerythrin